MPVDNSFGPCDMVRLNVEYVNAAASSQTRVQPRSYHQTKTKLTPSSIPSTAAHTRRAENTTNSTVNAPIRPYITTNTQPRKGEEGMYRVRAMENEPDR